MENIIDKEYFNGLLKITGLNESEPDREIELNLLISQYQQEYLDRMFGNGVTIDSESPLLPYIIDSERKISPLANYIYCIYQQNQASLVTNSGDKKITISNSIIADYRNKIVSAWNSMVTLNQIAHNKMYVANNIGTINYLNDIYGNMGNCAELISNDNQTTGIILKGGIFSTKTIYDYHK